MAEKQSPGRHTPGQPTTTTTPLSVQGLISGRPALRVIRGELAEAASLIDPAAETRHWIRIAREHYSSGYDTGYEEGAVAAIEEYKRQQHGLVREAQLEQPRHHVCCGPCRRTGHQPGCSACEDRDRETFGQPHPDDFPGQDSRDRAR